MKFQMLGTSELRVSSLAYGMWRFAGTDVKTAYHKVEKALEVGINFFDQADVYGCDGGGSFGDSEALLGDVFAQHPDLRKKMILATKGGIVLGVPYDSSSTYIRSAVEASLKRMNTDYIDLYQIHRPDFLGHPQELAGILTALRQEGKIREVGVSNYTTAQFDALQAHLDFSIVSHQPQFSCWHYAPLRDGILDQCLQHTVTPLAWSPMGGGTLGASYEQATDRGGDKLISLLKVLDRIASEQGVARSAVALAWILHHPSKPIPILGTQRLDRIVESVEAFEVQLSRTAWYEILVAAQGEALP